MTLAVLKQYGVACNRKDNSIKISSGITQKQNLPVVEADWSGASYFYALLAASEGGELFLNNLWLNSVQGDKVVSDIYKNWGIESEFNEKGVRIFKKNKYSATKFDYDFTNSPDLVQTLAVSCALTGVSGTFSGLQTLYIKETNRVQALDNELQKIGFQFEKIDHTTNQLISLQEVSPQEQKLQFQTYRDHRMAMAFSPVAMKIGNISIENPEVVGKSFPGFWQQLNNIGISTIFMSDL
jgi:3-phosphoshikimate 1-carboxyvinyltransferase